MPGSYLGICLLLFIFAWLKQKGMGLCMYQDTVLHAVLLVDRHTIITFLLTPFTPFTLQAWSFASGVYFPFFASFFASTGTAMLITDRFGAFLIIFDVSFQR
jgi:hypothetical protein